MTAKIAQSLLTERAAAAVKRILPDDDGQLALVSTWADDVKHSEKCVEPPKSLLPPPFGDSGEGRLCLRERERTQSRRACDSCVAVGLPQYMC